MKKLLGILVLGLLWCNKKERKTYECVYNFINTYNCYWSSPNGGYSSVLFKFNWNEKTGLEKILMIVFYGVLLYIINIIYWFIK